MGRPKFQRKKYDSPLHPWKSERIKTERDLMKKYGLKNHREVWKAKTFLRKYRRQARDLLATIGGANPQMKKESEQLLVYLTKMSILPMGSSLDDVLSLDTENILSRRLQTLVYHRGFAMTAGQARELVSHGHVAIGERKVTIPGYLVTKDEEGKIGYVRTSPLVSPSHPARPKVDVMKVVVPVSQVKEPQAITPVQPAEIQPVAQKKEEHIEPVKPQELSTPKEEPKKEKQHEPKQPEEQPKQPSHDKPKKTEHPVNAEKHPKETKEKKPEEHKKEPKKEKGNE